MGRPFSLLVSIVRVADAGDAELESFDMPSEGQDVLRRLESAWSNGKPAYRCRHGYCSAAVPDTTRPKNTYVREDQIMPHLAALAILAGKPACGSRARLTGPAGTVLTYDPASRTLSAGGHDAPSVAIGEDH